MGGLDQRGAGRRRLLRPVWARWGPAVRPLLGRRASGPTFQEQQKRPEGRCALGGWSEPQGRVKARPLCAAGRARARRGRFPVLLP